MKSAIYPGSFDPLTLGHIDIIKRAASVYDSLTVAVLDNPNKSPLFSVSERVNIIYNAVRNIPNVTVASYEGLLVDFAVKNDIGVIVRGLRSSSDFEYEFQMAQTNKKMCPKVETIFFATAPEYSYLSSSTVREAALFGGDITEFVPEGVAELVYSKIKH